MIDRLKENWDAIKDTLKENYDISTAAVNKLEIKSNTGQFD